MLDNSSLVWYSGSIVRVADDVRTSINWYNTIYMEGVNMNRFDIEEAIMSVWSVDQDIDNLLWKIMDSPEGPMTEDDLANYLIGVKSILNARCERLFDVYCKTFKLDHYRENKDV